MQHKMQEDEYIDFATFTMFGTPECISQTSFSLELNAAGDLFAIHFIVTTKEYYHFLVG